MRMRLFIICKAGIFVPLKRITLKNEKPIV
nr:MAG TPA: hypothetical protein [Caudoviricetes sp.]DAY87036.1 MAG TPA: hypothetical protein [Caudoviricetes sp.]